jgi:hypothetical protein
LTALAWAATTLACSRGDEPTSGATGAGGLQLAHTASCDDAPDPINDLIAVQFTGNPLSVVRTRCAGILRKSVTNPSAAMDLAIRLSGYIRQKSTGSLAQQTDLANAFLCVANGELPGPSCSFSQIPPGSNFRTVEPAGGGPFLEDEDQTAYKLAPGWSETPRIVFATPGPCVLNTPFAQFPECVSYGTIPDAPFAVTGSGVLAHCAIVPDGTNLANLRVARNIDDFNDPDATDAGGSEFYEDFTPDFSLPGCESPASVSRGGAGLAGGKGGGPGGAALAVTRKTQGGQISAFSDWGIVDIGTPAATVGGKITKRPCAGACVDHFDPFSGVTVNLFCDAGIGSETPAGPALLTDTNGKYSFPTIGYDFNIGSTCIVKASHAGFVDGSTDPFVVLGGANTLPTLRLEVAP